MRQRILLDSDTISLLRRGHERVTQHTSDYITIYGKLTFVELTWYEIVRGYSAVNAHHQLETFGIFCHDCEILPLDRRGLEHAANIYADLKRRGELIGEIDMLIAGVALAHGMGVATRNIAHFSRIANLHVEDWTR